MSNVNERLYEIQKMVEELIKTDDKKCLAEMNNMLYWKRQWHQEEERKLDDIFYFLNGVLFAKGIITGWSRTELVEKTRKEKK